VRLAVSATEKTLRGAFLRWRAARPPQGHALARKTHHVERFNGTLPQRASWLVRATLSFSKHLANHIGSVN